MRLAPLVLALAACGGPTRPAPPPADHPPRPAPVIEIAPIARWRSLDLTGANHAARLAALAVDADTRVAMARALLLAGDLACVDIDEHDQCGKIVRTMNPLRPAATFDDPCLRRVLALWSLAQLGPEDAAAIEPALLAMVSLPEPELELQDAAFALVPDDADELRIRMMTVTDPDRALDQVGELDDVDAVVHAATVLHLDTAVMRLIDEPELHRSTLLAAIADDRLTSETRAAAIEVYAGAADRASHDAIAAVADTDDDCGLAETAAETLASRGDPTRLPSRPRSRVAIEQLRALCMLSHSSRDDRDDLLLAWIGRRGLDTIDHHSDDYWEADPDVPEKWIERDDDVTTEHDRAVTITTTRVDRDELDAETVLEPFSERSDMTEWSCDDGRCVAGSVAYELVPAGGSMIVASIEIESYSGCGC